MAIVQPEQLTTKVYTMNPNYRYGNKDSSHSLDDQ